MSGLLIFAIFRRGGASEARDPLSRSYVGNRSLSFPALDTDYDFAFDKVAHISSRDGASKMFWPLKNGVNSAVGYLACAQGTSRDILR